MGRWAQRQRTGGGHSINFIVEATVADPTTLDLRYMNAVFDTTFDVTDFETDSNENPSSFSQVTPTTIALNYPGGLLGNSEIRYLGTVPDFLVGQIVLF